MNIKAKGMLFSFILILATTLFIGVGTYYRYKDILVDEVNQAVVRIAKESADHLNSYINQFVTPLVGLTEDKEIKSMDWSAQKNVIMNQINPQYQNIAVVDLNGMANYTDDTTIDVSDRAYIKETLTGKIAFSEVIISRKSGKPSIMVGVPIFKDGTLQGGLIARLDVDFLSDYAMTRGYGENGRAYIIAQDGSMISRPDFEKENTEYNLNKLAYSNQNYTSFAEFVNKSNSDQVGYGEYVFDNKNILMGYASIDETNWKMYIGTYEEDILDCLTSLKQLFAFLITLSLIVCTIAAWFFVDRFTKPIVELDHLFSQGAQGDFTIRFTPKTKDEIGRVGISFNRMMDKIKTLTQYDPLTSLLNQYVLEKDIEVLVHNDKIEDFVLVMAAVDKLSFINDTYGYLFGDAILVETAKRISICASDEHMVYRYKGDQFVVLCKKHYTQNEIEDKTHKLLDELKKSYFINGKNVDVNISMGTFTWNDENRMEEPLKAVTQAKNYAKYRGGNQIQYFDKRIHKKMKENRELQDDIINGLKEDQFFLVYQPLFNLENEEIAELEALIRWNHPKKGLLYPDTFIDLAESAGTIKNIDHWVIDNACKLLKSRREKNKLPVKLSINISSKTFEMDNFIPDLMSVIQTYGVDPVLLQLEITERMVINNVEEGISKLRELRSLGFSVAIDDFGIGYSSLSYIVRLPIDSIKIDKSFVQNISNSQEAKVIVSTIINLCKTLNLSVIAEGIEGKTELDYLKSNHCDIGQGYYFSKPISILEIEKLMEDADVL